MSIAESRKQIVTSEAVNYSQAMYSHPNYRYDPQFSNNFGQPIVLGASQIPATTINIPPEVFNLSRSYLEYTVNLPAGQAGTYTWVAQQCIKEISHLNSIVQMVSGSLIATNCSIIWISFSKRK